MKLKFSAIVLPTNVVLTFKNKKHGFNSVLTFNSSHANFSRAKELLDALLNEWDKESKIKYSWYEEFKTLHDANKVLSSWSDGKLHVTSSTVTFKGRDLDSDVCNFLIGQLSVAKDPAKTFTAWSNFLERYTQDNISYKARNRLFMFMSKNDLAIAEDGGILAYKVVRNDYKDCYSGTIDNSVGNVIEVPRSKVNDDDHTTCSHGLHLCSFDYLKDFASNGNRLMLVKVDPFDIVSIPHDYQGSKVRCCKYEVVMELGVWGTDVDPTTNPLTLFDFGFRSQ